MKKAEYKFHRDKKEAIQNQSRPNEANWYWDNGNPIFIPKRKKKK